MTEAGVAGSLTDLLHRITGQVNLELVLDISVRFITYSNNAILSAVMYLFFMFFSKKLKLNYIFGL